MNTPGLAVLAVLDPSNGCLPTGESIFRSVLGAHSKRVSGANPGEVLGQTPPHPREMAIQGPERSKPGRGERNLIRRSARSEPGIMLAYSFPIF